MKCLSKEEKKEEKKKERQTDIAKETSAFRQRRSLPVSPSRFLSYSRAAHIPKKRTGWERKIRKTATRRRRRGGEDEAAAPPSSSSFLLFPLLLRGGHAQSFELSPPSQPTQSTTPGRFVSTPRHFSLSLSICLHLEFFLSRDPRYSDARL